MAGFAAAALVFTSCTAKSPQRAPAGPRSVQGVPLAPNVSCDAVDCTTGYRVIPYVRDRSLHGIGCMGNVPPGTTANPEPPPQSYSVDDVGTSGVPKLRPEESAMLARIRRYVTSKTLRLAWLDGATTPNRFVIFDATDGPCETWAAGYAVLNGDCNEVYQPGENPYQTHAGSGCWPTARPWMPK